MSKAVSLVEQFVNTATHYQDDIAILYNDSALSFTQVNELSDRVAAGLTSRGIKRGDRVALYSINCDYFAVVYLGIIKAGAIAVPINLLLKPPEVVYILNDAAVRAIIFHPLLAEQVSMVRTQVPSLKQLFIIGDTGFDDAVALKDMMAQTASPPPEVQFNPIEDVASIIYTSGTTGHPKGAMLTHHNLVSNTNSCVTALDLKPGRDTLFTVLPMFHSFAHTVGMLLPLLHGCRFVAFPKFEPQLVADAISNTRATIFMGVPTMFGVLLGLAAGEENKLSSLRYCISGGAALPLNIMQKFEARFDVPIYEGDGPTECSPVTSVNPVGGQRKPGSIGVPIPDVEMAIYDLNGETLADTEIGEIVVRAPSVMKGYWQHPQETAESFYGDWYRTGDMGYRDEDGYFYIIDRIKDMLIVNGMNVYPKMVEKVINQHPGIAEVAVIGEANELHGEVPIAYISLESGHDVSTQEIVDFCTDKMAKYEIPRTVHFVDALPKTPTGKVLKRELRKQGERERGIDSA